MKKTVLAFALVVAAAAAPSPAADNGFYVGGSIVGSSLDISDFDEELGDIDFSDGDTASKLFAGYRFLSFLAVEAGYVDFGDPSDIIGGVDAIDVQIGLTGWDAFALGILPIGPVDVFGKIGMISWDADIRAALDDLVDNDSDSGTDAAYDLGVTLRLGSYAIRAEGEMFDVDGADDLYMLSVGATFTFQSSIGHDEPPEHACVPGVFRCGSSQSLAISKSDFRATTRTAADMKVTML